MKEFMSKRGKRASECYPPNPVAGMYAATCLRLFNVDQEQDRHSWLPLFINRYPDTIP